MKFRIPLEIQCIKIPFHDFIFFGIGYLYGSPGIIFWKWQINLVKSVEDDE